MLEIFGCINEGEDKVNKVLPILLLGSCYIVIGREKEIVASMASL